MTILKKILMFFFFVLVGIFSLNSVYARTKSPGIVLTLARKGYYPVMKNVPILPDVVVVKRSVSGLLKAEGGSWQKTLQRIGAVSVLPMFPTHSLQKQFTRDDLSRIFKIHLSPGSNVYRAVSILSQDPSVEYAEPWYLRKIFYTPDDPAVGSQWYLDQVKAQSAWDIFKDDTTVVIGIIDSGVFWDHPDLAKNIWKNPGEIPDDNVDNDHNGYVDDVRGWDFGGAHTGQPDNDPVEATAFHGTAVAGVASAVTDNGIGIAAPAFNAKIMVVKATVDDDQNHYIVFGDQGIVYAADNGADIINCSFGGSGGSNAERDVINYVQNKGVLIVAAAGNEANESPAYPASYPGVLSVAAADKNDLKASFSNWDYSVDLSAPGVGIYTTWGENSYTLMNGTSFSSPLVASIAALLKGYHPDWTGDQIGEQIRISADPIDNLNPSYSRKLGRGRVDAYRALTVSLPSIRIVDCSLVEGEKSNQNGIFDPGEELLLTFKIKNFLKPATGIMVNVESDNKDVTISGGTFQLPVLNTLEEKDNKQNPVIIQISPEAARRQKINLFFNISADNGYEDFDHFDFTIPPVYATIHASRVGLTLSSTGRLGFVDYPDNTMGDGFVFRGENLLFEGALIAAVSQDSVSDVARGTDQNVQNNDFNPIPEGELVINKPGKIADEEGEAIFSDEAAQNSLHIQVAQTSLTFHDSTNGGYVLLSYKITNLSSNPLKGLYFGLFMDWDVGDNGNNAGENLPGYEENLNLGYVYDPITSLYGGLEVVSKGGASIYKSIKNPDEIYDGYSDAEKWADLSGGVQAIEDSSLSDYSHVVGVGPLTINPDDTVRVGFAVLAGNGLAKLKVNAQFAREKWKELFEGGTKPKQLSYSLDQNYPNPFKETTTIGYDLVEKSSVILTVYDILGHEVARLVEEVQGTGHHEVTWDGSTSTGWATSGVYFYKLKASSFEKVRKMIILR